MVINKTSFLDFTKLQLFSDTVVVLDNDLSNFQIEDILQSIFIFEAENTGKNIKIELNGFSADQIIHLYRYVFNYQKFLDIRNVSIILNILNLVKTFNTFDDAFFASKDVFVKSLEQFLDVKLALMPEVNKLVVDLFSAFNSMLCSASKVEYTMLDGYEDMPIFYRAFFSGIDLVTLYGIFSAIDQDDVHVQLKKYKDSMLLLNHMVEKHKIANVLMTQLLGNFTNA